MCTEIATMNSLKKKIRIDKNAFEFKLNIIRSFIEKTAPANLVPNPVAANQQLGLILSIGPSILP